MGVAGVRMYHDQALYKEPGGGITPWHVDQVYWPVSNNNTYLMISMLVKDRLLDVYMSYVDL